MKNISERDKKLLLLLLIVLVIALPYFLFVQPMITKNAGLTEDIAALNAEKAVLEQHEADAPYYREEIEAMGLEEEEILSRFPAGLPQEAGILFAHETEPLIPLKLHQLALGDIMSTSLTPGTEGGTAPEAAGVSEEGELEALDDTVSEEVFGEEADPAAMPEATDAAPAAAGLMAESTTLQFAYSAGYQEFKDFLAYIRTFEDRMVITELTAGFSLSAVNGSFKLMQYAITGAGREPVAVDKPVIPQGTTNIFLAAAGGVGDASAEVAPSDFFIMLNRPEATMEAKIVGKSEDGSGSSHLISDDNSEQEITVTFEGSEGTYTAAYSIDDESQEGDPVEFTKEGPIYLEIISSPRAEEDDEVAAGLNITNHTDRTLYVTEHEDDAENPRINILSQTGDVVILPAQ